MKKDPKLTPEERQAFMIRRYGSYKRLLEDTDFVEVFLDGFLLGLREQAIKEQRRLRGVELERSCACVDLLDDIRAHPREMVEDYEQTLAAAAERQERLDKGLPVDDD